MVSLTPQGPQRRVPARVKTFDVRFQNDFISKSMRALSKKSQAFSRLGVLINGFFLNANRPKCLGFKSQLFRNRLEA